MGPTKCLWVADVPTTTYWVCVQHGQENGMYDNFGEMKNLMNQKNIEHPKERADRQGEGLVEVSTIQIRGVDFCLMNKQVQVAL